MKKKTKITKVARVLSFALLGIIAALIIGALVTYGNSMMALLSSGSGVLMASMAGAAVGGTVTTGTQTEAGIAMQDISSIVTKIRPDDVPLDTLLREIGKGEKAEALDISFYQSTMRNNKVTLKNAYTSTATLGSAELTLDSVKSILVDDVLISTNTKAPNGKNLILHVVDKNIPQNKITVIAVNGTFDLATRSTIVPSIAANEIIYCMGTAKNELDAKTDAFQMMPIKDNNYVQTFMAQVSESVYAEMSKKEVDFGLLEFKADAVFDYRMKANMSAMFGAKAHLIDPIDDKEKFFMGGINEFLGLRLEYVIGSKDDALGLTGKRLIDIGEQLFSDVNGSESRVWLCGSKAMAELMKNAEWQKQVESKNTVIKYGITFNEIETGFGKVYLKHDKSMNHCGQENNIMSIDPTKIRKRDFMPMKWRELNLQSTGAQRSNDWVLEEAFTIEVRNPNCHALIVGKTA